MTAKKFSDDVLSGTMGTVIAYGLGILLLPLITRFYKPEHIGAWQTLLATITILVSLATLRLEDAIVLEKSDDTSFYLLSVILFNTTFICIALFFLALYVGDDSILVFNFRVTNTLIWFSIIGLLFQVSFLTLTALIVKQKKFRVQARAKVIGAVIIPLIAMVALLFFEASKAVYIIATLSSIFIQSLLLFKWVDTNNIFHFNSWTKEKTIEAIRKYKVYPTYMVPYGLSQGVVWQITLISLSIFFSSSTVGAYTVARQLVFIPVSLLTTGLRNVIFSYASSAPRFDEIINNRIRKLLINIVTLAIPFSVFSFYYLPSVINYVLGDGWEEVGEFSRWIVISAVMIMLTAWLDRILDVYGRQRLAVFLQVSSDVLFLLVLYICYLVKADSTETVAYISIYLAIYNLSWLYIVLKILGFSPKFWLSVLTRILLIGFVAYITIELLDFLLPFIFALMTELSLLVAVSYFVYTQSRVEDCK